MQNTGVICAVFPGYGWIAEHNTKTQIHFSRAAAIDLRWDSCYGQTVRYEVSENPRTATAVRPE